MAETADEVLALAEVYARQSVQAGIFPSLHALTAIDAASATLYSAVRAVFARLAEAERENDQLRDALIAATRVDR